MPPLPLFSFLGSFLPRETDDRMWGCRVDEIWIGRFEWKF
jgi:hypothetical protein